MKKIPPLDLYAGATADRSNTNFPKRPNGLGFIDTETDILYVHVDGGWHGLGAPGIPEPPDDAATYGRKTDGTSSWVAVVPVAGGEYTGDVGFGITPAYPIHSLGEIRHEFSPGNYIQMKDSGLGVTQINARDPSDNLSTFSINGSDVQWNVGTGTGTGTPAFRALYSSGIRLGFYNTTPIVQPTAVKATVALQNLGLGTSLIDYVAATGGTFSGAVAISSGGLTVEGGAVFNDAGADVDGRVEGDTDQNLTYWDAGNNRVGIGTGSPQEKLHVEGSIKLGATTPTITANTSDGNDNTWVGMSGGSAASSARAGYFQFFGNEYAAVPAFAGNVLFEAGNVSTGDIRFYTQGAQRMHIDYAGNIGIGTAAPAASALLELSSTTGGLLFPRLTTTQQNALTGVNGLVIYNASTNKLRVYAAGAWVDLH